MADVQASYSIGSASDYFRLIHGTSMPLAGVVADAITRVVRLQTGRDLEPYFDFDEHPTMQQVRGERIDAAQKLWGMGVPMKEINDYLDMGMKPYSGWDLGYLPFSVAPVGEGAEDPAGTAAAEVDPLEATKALFLTRSAAPVVHETGCPCCDAKGATSREWMAHWQSRQATIKTYKAKFDRHLMSARNAVLGHLGRGKKSAAVEFVFDLEEWEAGLQVEMGKAGRDALNKAGRGVFAEIGREDDAWTMPPAKALAYLQKRENFFLNIADSIHKQILGSLEDGFQAGETTDELATRIRAEFAGISKQRALRIAMTETSAAYGAARQEAISQSGIKFKRWLTSGNANVRPSHRAAEGQIVPKDEPFIIGGASVMHPGDGSLGAPAEEIINCHCVAVASETED
jgi:SPP1 gp7 family putative phage head morphogenesis protein